MIAQLWRNTGLIVAAFVIVLTGIFFGRPVILLIGVFLLVLTGFAEWMAGQTLTNIGLEHQVSHRVMEIGQTVVAEMVFENRMPWPIAHVSWENSLPQAVDVHGPGKLVDNAPAHRQVLSGQLHVGANERVRVQYRLTGRARGRWMVGPAAVWFSDTFGFTRLYRDMPDQIYITVWPKRYPIAAQFVSRNLLEGTIRGRPWDVPEPYRIAGTRPYVLGDPVRHIHPYASARSGQLMVKQLETVQNRHLEVIVHPLTHREHWMGIDVDVLEDLLSLAASVVESTLLTGIEVGLTLSGSLPGYPYGYTARPRRGQNVLAEYLTALSWLQPSGAIHQILVDRMAEMSWRVNSASVVVLVLALWEPAMAPILAVWRRRGTRVVIVTNGDLDQESLALSYPIYRWREGRLAHA
ncbi:MAG: DUF58 domain-containing protein [Sulfobacillus sp.]